jgi:anaerobic selenocysteine-containing dehydrogenase
MDGLLMSGNEINRRDFLKFMGWGGAGAAALTGCDMPSYVTLQQGKEDVIPYVVPEEFNIPGVGVWYASTCRQCPAGCGIHGRVREGRVLKVEGNPYSPINKTPATDPKDWSGKLCQMGQSGLQNHYNPDRVTKPLLRKGGSLVEASWDEALGAIKEKVGAGSRLGWLTGTISGHQAVLLQAHMEGAASARHYTHEVVNTAVTQAVNKTVLGEALPLYRIDQAKVILSLGADFLGAWQSPVHFSTMFAKFRSAPRGTLVQVEPKMTLTGGNADLWLAIRPGTEGAFAMGVANLLLTKFNRDGSQLPADVRSAIAKYDVDTASNITGIPGDRFSKVANWLNGGGSQSVVLSGMSAEGHEHGYDSAAAAMLLNIVLGSVGKTIVSSGEFPFEQLVAKEGNTQSLRAFADALDKGEHDAVFVYGANPVFTSPDYMDLGGKLDKAAFKVVMTNFHDETAMHADVVLPMHSQYEEWGTHVPAYQGDGSIISMQQPVMEPLHHTTRSFGDVMLALLKMQNASKYGAYKDYYGYLQQAFASLPADVKQGAATDEAFWQQTVQKGLLPVKRKAVDLTAKALAVNVPDYTADSEYPYHLIPSPRLGMWDGRHANIPWLQEAPDQISKMTWDSWAEMHPKTATKLGVKDGDYIKITSAQGSIETRVFIFKGIHVDAIAVPLGQGHTEYGRYAKDRGVNPLKILSPAHDAKTGELAMYATRVKVAKTGRNKPLLEKLGGSDTQHGRKLVSTVTAEVFRRTEGGGKDVV